MNKLFGKLFKSDYKYNNISFNEILKLKHFKLCPSEYMRILRMDVPVRDRIAMNLKPITFWEKRALRKHYDETLEYYKRSVY